MPVSKGGENTLENLVTACAECNLGKSDGAVPAVPKPAMNRPTFRKHPLVGYAFLSFVDGDLNEQGIIKDVIEVNGDTIAVCLYFEWQMGEATFCRLIPVDEMTFRAPGSNKKTYRLFENNQQKNEYYQYKTYKGSSFPKGST